MLVDAGHRILLANAAVASHFGIDPQGLVGKYCPKAIHDSDVPIPHCPLEECVQRDAAVETEYYDDKHGRWLRLGMYPSAQRARNGGRVYVHLVQDVTDRKAAEESLRVTVERLRHLVNAVTSTIGMIVEARDPYTAQHQVHVSQLSYAIAKELGWDEQRCESVLMAGLVHDVGKLTVPIEILCRPGRLGDIEMSMIRTHPVKGYRLLESIDFPWPIAQMVLEHHERLDGSGYPQGLTATQTMMEAKILAVADVVSVMSSHRPYRPAPGVERALDEIHRHQGLLYDPRVVGACIKVFTEGGFRFADELAVTEWV